MPRREWRLRITDILEAIEAILEYTQGMDLESLSTKRQTIYAVVRNITIIGEAARNLPKEVTDRNPEIPWRDMGDMRNVLVHIYFGVDLDVLWKTIRDDLPPLIPQLRKILAQ